MPDAPYDPVDHSRTTRQHAGTTMKAGKNAPGLIAVWLGVAAMVIGLFSFANGSRTTGVIAEVIAGLLLVGGALYLALSFRRTQRTQVRWHAAHPDHHYEPPTS